MKQFRLIGRTVEVSSVRLSGKKELGIGYDHYPSKMYRTTCLRWNEFVACSGYPGCRINRGLVRKLENAQMLKSILVVQRLEQWPKNSKLLPRCGQ